MLKKYSYTIQKKQDANITIKDIVTAGCTQEVYTIVSNIISDLNEIAKDDIWELGNIENGYFCGVTEKVEDFYDDFEDELEEPDDECHCNCCGQEPLDPDEKCNCKDYDGPYAGSSLSC